MDWFILMPGSLYGAIMDTNILVRTLKQVRQFIRIPIRAAILQKPTRYSWGQRYLLSLMALLSTLHIKDSTSQYSEAEAQVEKSCSTPVAYLRQTVLLKCGQRAGA